MTATWLSREEIARSGLFNADWYQQHYPDVRQAGLDPLDHFLHVGQRIGRDPGPDFDSALYAKVQGLSGLPPLTHFLRQGWQAGLTPGPQRLAHELGPAHPVVRVGVPDCRVQDFRLTLRGWALRTGQPQSPTLLTLTSGAEVVGRTWARFPAADGACYAPFGAMMFRLVVTLPPAALVGPLRLSADSGTVVFDIPPPWLTADATRRQDKQPLRPVFPGQRIDGKVEAVTHSGIDGWAIYPEQPDATVELLLRLNGRPFAHVRTGIHRPDIRDRLGGDGWAGFHVDLPANLQSLGPITWAIEPMVGQGQLADAQGTITWPGVLVPAPAGPPNRALLRSPGLTPPMDLAGPQVSVILLSRNGGGLLDALFRSARHMDDGSAVEWIVIDHQSTDNTAAVCATARAAGLDVRRHPRNGNFSFSQSNNLGLTLARGRIVLFANNDLILQTPFARRLDRVLADPAIGAVGAVLMDVLPSGCDLTAPVQHLGVHIRPQLENGNLRGYESRPSAETPLLAEGLVPVPAVTGAFLAMRRADALAIGGFDERYSYGLEDIDLCLRLHRDLGMQVVTDHGLRLAHHRGISRTRGALPVQRKADNNRRFGQVWGAALRRTLRQDVLTRPGFWTGARPVIAFAVNETGALTTAGDYIAALHLGRALQRIVPAHIRFLPRSDWKDLSGVDVLICMVNGFDITQARQVNPALVSVNWMRQWFDRWAEDPTLTAYDHLWVSSAQARDWLAAQTGLQAEVMPLATDPDLFDSGQRRPELSCDYCFAGNVMGVARDIAQQLKPGAIAGTGRIFGHHWDDTPLAALAQGPVPHDRLPDVFASTRVVIDDANIATKAWGSVNARVFDAIAAGCLVISNGADGVQALFGDLVPTFHDRDSLTATLNHWLADEPGRLARVAALQDIVRTQHTFDHRAADILRLLAAPPPVRVAIKTAAIKAERDSWGDFHFAGGLAAALRRQGFVVRVDCREDNDAPIADTDDVCIVLRGLVPHRLRSHQKNILWLVSHPDNVAPAELALYDRVHVASAGYAQGLAALTGSAVGFLPQCTDPVRFRFDPDAVARAGDRVLFVGNSRGVFRNSVRWSMDRDLGIDIFGQGWEGFLGDGAVKGQFVPNTLLPGFYAESRMVLNDHWDDMRRAGFVSNRVFDVLSAGGRLVTDDVAGLADLLADLPGGSLAYDLFRDADDLEQILRSPAQAPDIAQRAAVAAWVAQHHSFDARAAVLAQDIRALTGRLEQHPIAAAEPAAAPVERIVHA